MNNLILNAVKITKVFKKSSQEIHVLRGVDISVEKGERVAIMGASGAGKSTLLHVLGTLEPPTSGQIFFGTEKKSLTQMGDSELSYFRNRSLGFVFQFHHLLPEFSAVENVMMPALLAGVRDAEARVRAKELLDFVGLGHRLDHRPAELSGGEQQRVAVARAVVLKPKLLLADELTGNLDSKNRDLILDLLFKFGEATQTSILLVTHDEWVAKRMHRVLTMSDGRFI